MSMGRRIHPCTIVPLFSSAIFVTTVIDINGSESPYSTVYVDMHHKQFRV